ncbi:MAG TPA: 2-amino-4-hydroxy-6-hydroxymethyldihydropteridine diphosphokinase [Candidatus Acidoferrum sp.]|nr:2-amino-4-hydroxy-6-hydroxymethyldihydropteridine diphosphokinase [Candidatus Acidoferrum sp.]
MADPIRITFREGVEHFIEAQNQSPPPLGKSIPEKTQRIILGVVLVAALAFAFGQEYRRGVQPGILLLTLGAVMLTLAFWYWVFKKIGLLKPTRIYDYQWTNRDRERLEKVYRKHTGRADLQVTYVFDDSGFTVSPEQVPSKNYSWSTIVRAIERPKGLFIYVRSWMYLWIPKAAFASPEDYRAVLALVAAKVKRWEKLNLEGMAYVALGSNLGRSVEILHEAVTWMRQLSEQPFLKSSLWQTSPVDCPPGSPMFVNAVVALTPPAGETPESLLPKLQRIEKNFGRAPKRVLNEPRPLDLDLIAFGSEVRNSPDLVLPHPRAHMRRFVLQPLSEIAPDLLLPGQSKTVFQLLKELPPGETVIRA